MLFRVYSVIQTRATILSQLTAVCSLIISCVLLGCLLVNVKLRPERSARFINQLFSLVALFRMTEYLLGFLLKQSQPACLHNIRGIVLMVAVYSVATGNLAMITGGCNLGRVGTIVSRERHPGSFDICHIKDTMGHTFATRCVLEPCPKRRFIASEEVPGFSHFLALNCSTRAVEVFTIIALSTDD